MASPNLNALLAVCLKQLQKAEDALNTGIITRFLGFAAGAHLDAIGRLVGEARLGKLDPDYRKAIRLRIYVNGSSGRPEDLIYVARQLTGFQVVNYLDVPQASGAGGNCRIVIPGWTADAGQVHAFLQSICPAGVRLIDVTTGAALVPFRMGDVMGTRLMHT